MRKMGGILSIAAMLGLGHGSREILESEAKRSSKSTAVNGSASSTKRKKVKLARKAKLRNQK